MEVTAAKLTDDLVVDILSRLTYKSFCRCKCAYKAWSTLSSNPDYSKKLPTKVTTGLLYQSNDKSAIPLVSFSRNDGEIDGVLADVPHYEHLELVDCCNGLVLCKYMSGFTSPGICRFVVCNPATREWRTLPDTHSATDDPLYVTILAFDPSWSPQFYVFNFHLKHEHHLILGTSNLEIFSSEISLWLVDDTWDPEITFPWWKPHLFLNGMMYVETTGAKIVVFEGFEAMGHGILPYHWSIELPPDALYVASFTNGCFGKSSGILHYALPHKNGHSIVVWTLDDYADNLFVWNVKCHLSMKDAFGRDDLVYYDNAGFDGGPEFFWNCDYQVVSVDLERELVLLCDKKTKGLLLYNIRTGELNKIRDDWWLCQCSYYVPCYSELPAQGQPSV